MRSKEKILPVLAILSCAMIWGLMWYPFRVLRDAGISGELATFLGFAIALLIGLPLMGPIWRELRLAGRWGIVLMVSAGCTNLGYVMATLDGEVMRVLLLFYLAPLWTVLLSRWLLAEKLNRYGYGIVALSLAGALVMLSNTQPSVPLPQNRAEWIGLTAGMSFALLNVSVRRAQHLSVNFKTTSVWVGAVLFTAILLLYQGSNVAQIQSISSDAWWLLGLIGLVLCASSIVVQYGLTNMPANQAIILFLSELVFAALSAYLLTGERMGAREIIGATLIVMASLLSGKMYNLGKDK